MKKINLIFLMTLGFIGIFPLNGEASNLFQYGNGETELFFDNFSTNSNDWNLGTYTKIENGELKSQDLRFVSAVLNLDRFNNLNLDDADYYLYWSVKAINPNGTRNDTERSKTFIELDILENQDEDREIKMAVRPPEQASQNNYHQLYLDPGFMIPHEADAFLDVPDGQLNNGVYEDFRLHVSKTGPDIVEVMPYYWDNAQWQEFNVQSTTPSGAGDDAQNPPLQELPMELSISENMSGKNDFESITLRFTNPGYAAFDAFAITNISDTEQDNQVSVPEFSSIISLGVFMGLGFLSQTSRKIQVR